MSGRAHASMARPPFLPTVRRGLASVAVRPHLVLLMLLVNLLASWVLTAPIRGLLRATLDRNLYGDTMATGASWRWFDTVSRTSGPGLLDFSLFRNAAGADGLFPGDFLHLAGPLSGAVLAALILLWANSLLVCGFLAHLHPDHRGGFGNAVVRFLFPASALTFFAVLSYGAAYFVCFVLTGYWLGPFAESFPSQGAVLALTAARFAVTLLVLLVLKVLFDLARVVLVDRDGWNWPWAFLMALRELVRLRGRNLLRYLALGAFPTAAALLLTLLWWPLGSLLAAPQGWIVLLLAFLAQQVFVALRIGLRLSGIAAMHHLYQSTRTVVDAKPPFKVPRPRTDG